MPVQIFALFRAMLLSVSLLGSRHTQSAIASIRDLWQLPPQMMCEVGDFVLKLCGFHVLPCLSTLACRIRLPNSGDEVSTCRLRILPCYFMLLCRNSASRRT